MNKQDVPEAGCRKRRALPVRIAPCHVAPAPPGGQELAFFSTIATFGTARDITIAELSIESYFPPTRAPKRRCAPPSPDTRCEWELRGIRELRLACSLLPAANCRRTSCAVPGYSGRA